MVYLCWQEIINYAYMKESFIYDDPEAYLLPRCLLWHKVYFLRTLANTKIIVNREIVLLTQKTLVNLKIVIIAFVDVLIKDVLIRSWKEKTVTRLS